MERGGNTYTYHRDALGSITEITDAGGSLVERYEYDVYGTASIFDDSGNSLTASAIGNPYLFTARRYDPESGNYYYRARMYSPSLGRFLQMDPLGFEASDLNLYVFVGNSAVNWIDFLGLEPYSPQTEVKLQEIAPLMKQNIEATLPQIAQQCSELYQAVALKFIADEYDERRRWFGFKGLIDEYYQDWRARHGLLTPLGTQGWEFVGWAENYEHWKRSNLFLKWLLRTWNIKYHDLGPANIELKTALELIGEDFEAASTTLIEEVMKFLTTDEVTAIFALYFATEAVLDLHGHLCSCKYDRKSVEIMVARIQEGEEYFWNRRWEKRRKLTPEQFEQWRRDPNSFPGVPLLDPGELDDDKFTFIEGLVGITIK